MAISLLSVCVGYHRDAGISARNALAWSALNLTVFAVLAVAWRASPAQPQAFCGWDDVALLVCGIVLFCH